MASEAQIAANRSNAQKSIGPTSQAGRAKSRMNACRDRITGQIITLSEEDLPIFLDLKDRMIKSFKPIGEEKLQLASSITWDTWRLNRIRGIEISIFAYGTIDPSSDPLNRPSPEQHTAESAGHTFEKKSPKFGTLSLYGQRLDHSIQRNRAELKAIQAERTEKYERELAEEVLLARYSDMEGMEYEAPKQANANGFVFSTSEILAAAPRHSKLEVIKFRLKKDDPKVQCGGAGGDRDPEPAKFGSEHRSESDEGGVIAGQSPDYDECRARSVPDGTCFSLSTRANAGPGARTEPIETTRKPC